MEITAITSAVVKFANAVVGAEKAKAGIYIAVGKVLHSGVAGDDVKAALTTAWEDKGLVSKTLANKMAVINGMIALQGAGVNVPALLSHCASENAVKMAVAKAAKDAGVASGKGRPAKEKPITAAVADAAKAKATKAQEKAAKAAAELAKAQEKAAAGKKGDAVLKAAVTLAEAKAAELAKAAAEAKADADNKAAKLAAGVTGHAAPSDAETDAAAVKAVVEAFAGLRDEIGDDADLLAAFLPCITALGKYDAVLRKAFAGIGK